MAARVHITIILLALIASFTVLAITGKIVLPPLPPWETISLTSLMGVIGYLIPSPLFNKHQIETIVRKVSNRPPPMDEQ